MASSDTKIRKYIRKDVVHFRTTTGTFGPLSNMAPDFPIYLLNTKIPTAEALYQACRFPTEPRIQKEIIDQLSPMTAKMKSKKFRNSTREDWDDVRVNIMRWCLRFKLAQHWRRFGDVLTKTGDLPIVEESTKDEFWGAKPQTDGTLVGQNILGRLLMELREEYRSVEAGRESTLKYPESIRLCLFGHEIEPSKPAKLTPAATQPAML